MGIRQKAARVVRIEERGCRHAMERPLVDSSGAHRPRGLEIYRGSNPMPQTWALAPDTSRTENLPLLSSIPSPFKHKATVVAISSIVSTPCPQGILTPVKTTLCPDWNIKPNVPAGSIKPLSSPVTRARSFGLIPQVLPHPADEARSEVNICASPRRLNNNVSSVIRVTAAPRLVISNFGNFLLSLLSLDLPAAVLQKEAQPALDPPNLPLTTARTSR